MRRPKGRTRIFCDYAMAESLFGALKNEWLSSSGLPCTDVAPTVRNIVPGWNRINLHPRPVRALPVKKVVSFPEVSNRVRKDPSAVLRR